MTIVLDTSVYLDLYMTNPERKLASREVMRRVSELTVYEPRIFLVEFSALLSRKSKEKPSRIIQQLLMEVNIIEESDLFDMALQLAPMTQGRAVDLYFIATAKLTESALITSDRIQALNARKCNLVSFYLLEEREECIRYLEALNER